MAGPGSPSGAPPRSAELSPLARARPPAQAPGVYTPTRAGGAAARRRLGSVVPAGRGTPGLPGKPLPRKLQFPEGQARAEATW